jgi:hypothetical protein
LIAPATTGFRRTDRAIFTVSSRLIDIAGQWLMNCFDGRPVNDERFKWGDAGNGARARPAGIRVS